MNDLREHKKIHFLNLPCNQCDKVFKSRRSLLGHLSIAHKDSGVPPPPPPPSGPFTSTLTVPSDPRRSPSLSTSSPVSAADATQQLNLSLYSSLSAINSYFSGSGLDVDLTTSAADKMTSSVAQNLLSEFDKRLGAMSGVPSSLSSGNALSRALASNTNPSPTLNEADILNLAKGAPSSDQGVVNQPVASSIPMEVSVQ